ncbi:MAG: MFS transporter [Alicyclobacillus sp.]|nr:MFS transporter [Alicyclobacillus sp.]
MPQTGTPRARARWLYLMPVFFLVNFFGFMDRQVMSIALPGGMMQDLAMNATLAGFASGIFSIGALCLQVQAGQLAQKARAKWFLAGAIVVWSLCSGLTGWVHHPWQLMVLRFVLGVAEGSLSPAVVTLLAFWFPDQNGERNRAISFYFTSVSAAALLTGPLGGMLIAAFNWRIMFLIMGIISFLTALLWIAIVVDRPEQARWLSSEEKEYVVAAVQAEQEAVRTSSTLTVSGQKLGPVLAALVKSKPLWALCIIGFCVNVGQFGFSLWMPTAIKNLTHAGMAAVGWISALPSLAAIAGLWVWSWIARRVQQRRLTTGVPLLCFALALGLATAAGGQAVLAIALMCLIGFFLQAHMPSFYSIPSLVFVKELDGAARGMIGVAMGLGSFVGPYLTGFLLSLTGSQTMGMWVMAIILTIGFAVSFVLPKQLLGVKHPHPGEPVRVSSRVGG